MYGFRPVHKFRERGPKTSFHTEIPDFQVNVYVYVCFHRAACQGPKFDTSMTERCVTVLGRFFDVCLRAHLSPRHNLSALSPTPGQSTPRCPSLSSSSPRTPSWAAPSSASPPSASCCSMAEFSRHLRVLQGHGHRGRHVSLAICLPRRSRRFRYVHVSSVRDTLFRVTLHLPAPSAFAREFDAARVTHVTKRPARSEIPPCPHRISSSRVLTGLLDAAWDPLQIAEPSVSMERIIAAGLLVGAGTGMGNGCTSGHGICGNSRFSVRAWCTPGSSWPRASPPPPFRHQRGARRGLHPCRVVRHDPPLRRDDDPSPRRRRRRRRFFLSLGAASKALSKKSDDEHTSAHETLNIITEALSGLVFGIGLSISGMRRAAKVSGFLSRSRPPSIPRSSFVMGGAMAVAIPGFQMVKSKKKPVCGKEFGIPKNNKLDKKLLTGGVLFGAGWGLAGLCPGPAIVSAAARPTVSLVAWLGSVAVGMWGQKFIKM